MSFEPREYLRHILAETEYLIEQSHGRTLEDFRGDETLQRAFIRSLEVIGEAVKKLPADFIAQYPQIEWRLIAGMRDRLIHGYFKEVARIRSFLGEYPTAPRPDEPAAVPISDPDDAWVLASAIASGAEVFVTGDAAILGLSASATRLQILSPRTFWESQRGLRPEPPVPGV